MTSVLVPFLAVVVALWLIRPVLWVIARRIVHNNPDTRDKDGTKRPYVSDAWQEARRYGGWKAFVLRLFVISTWALIVTFPMAFILMIASRH